MKQLPWKIMLLAIFAVALWLRLDGLGRRPMHHDEANQAVRFAALLEDGRYEYDPLEHHGPTLYYLTLPFAWLTAGTDFAATTETTFRLVTVIAGVALVLMLVLIADGIGRAAVVYAALLTATSPAMVYYSRLYVHEMLLVLFTFGAIGSGWRYTRSRRIPWAILTGIFLGMMYATKESSVVAYAAMAIAACAATRGQGSGGRGQESAAAGRRSLVAGPAVVFPALSGAIIIAILFYSSFFTHWRGVSDSLLAFTGYAKEAGSGGDHVQPWYYYIKLLAFGRSGSGPVFTELLILVLATVGLAETFIPRMPRTVDRRFLRFIAVYTLVMTVVYSAAPYKTPWCMLSFLHGMIILAGVGASALVGLCRVASARAAVAVLLVAGSADLARQARMLTTRYCADERNPCAYVQTASDYLKLVDRIHDLAEVSAEGRHMFVASVTYPHDQWPLPWYLRGYENVGYWTDPAELKKLPPPSVLVVSPHLPGIEKALRNVMTSEYQEELYGLRPGVFLRLYIRSDLWDSFMKTRQQQ